MLLKNGLLAFFALILGVGVSVYINSSDKDEARAPALSLYEIELPDLEGQPQDLSHWRGSLVLVNFWASWCPPCRKEIPVFMTVLNKYRDRNFQVLGISIENAADAKKFRDEVAIAYPLYDGNKAGLSIMMKMGNATGALPYSVLFDRKGKIIFTKTGEFTLQELDELIKSNL